MSVSTHCCHDNARETRLEARWKTKDTSFYVQHDFLNKNPSKSFKTRATWGILIVSLTIPHVSSVVSCARAHWDIWGGTLGLRCVLCLYETNVTLLVRKGMLLVGPFLFYGQHTWKWLADTIVLGEKEKGVCVCGRGCEGQNLCHCMFHRICNRRKVGQGLLTWSGTCENTWRTLYFCHYYRCYHIHGKHTPSGSESGSLWLYSD